MPTCYCWLPATQYARAVALAGGSGRVFYFGNSRVEGEIGFGMAGVAGWARAAGTLVGLGQLDPACGVVTTPLSSANVQGWVVPSIAHNGTPVLLLSEAIQLNTPNLSGVQITTAGSGVITMGGVSASVDHNILDSDELTWTLVYRVGPSEGIFSVQPLVAGAPSGSPIVVDCSAVSAAAAYVKVTALGGAAARGLQISATTGDCIIYTYGVEATAKTGIVVGRIGIGGQGFVNQMRTTEGAAPRCARADWITAIEAFDPTVCIAHHANNQTESTVDFTAALVEMVERCAEVREDICWLLAAENQFPHASSAGARATAWTKLGASWRSQDFPNHWIDPLPYLPAEFAAIEGTGVFGTYFRDGYHENADGSLAVVTALIDDLIAKVASL